MEQLGQLTKNPDHEQHTDQWYAHHTCQCAYNLKELDQKKVPYPLSASGRNWDGTETIWPKISI